MGERGGGGGGVAFKRRADNYTLGNTRDTQIRTLHGGRGSEPVPPPSVQRPLCRRPSSGHMATHRLSLTLCLVCETLLVTEPWVLELRKIKERDYKPPPAPRVYRTGWCQIHTMDETEVPSRGDSNSTDLG